MNNQQKDPENPIISFKENNQKLFRTAASALTQLFANNNHSYDEGYAQGRQDAFEEVFKWFMHQNDGSSLRHVSVVSFFNFIDEKLKSTGSILGQSKRMSSMISNSEMQSESDSGNNDSSNRTFGNLSRFSSDQRGTSSELIRSNNTNHLIRKVNVNLSGFNISDSRKRKREPFKFAHEDDNNIESEHDDFPMSLRDNSGVVKQIDPFRFEKEEEPLVHMPKRMKLKHNLYQDSSNN